MSAPTTHWNILEWTRRRRALEGDGVETWGFLVDDQTNVALPMRKTSDPDDAVPVAFVAVPNNVREHFFEAQIHREPRAVRDGVQRAQRFDTWGTRFSSEKLLSKIRHSALIFAS
jgi:hypothetical protein